MFKEENPYKMYEIDEELKALKKKSNTELICLYNQGHPKAFTGLIYKNEGMIHLLIYRTREEHKKSFADIVNASSDTSVEDLEQIGYMALYSAIGTYDLEKGVQFSTWLSNTIEWDIMKYFRTNKIDKAIRQTSLNRMISEEDDSGVEVGDLLESEDNSELRAIDSMFAYELNIVFDRAFKELYTKEENVIRLYYGLTEEGEEFSVDEISEALNLNIEGIKKRRLAY